MSVATVVHSSEQNMGKGKSIWCGSNAAFCPKDRLYHGIVSAQIHDRCMGLCWGNSNACILNKARVTCGILWPEASQDCKPVVESAAITLEEAA